VVEGVSLSDFAKGKIKLTTDELLAERDVVKELLG
jgi:hypothetical protein